MAREVEEVMADGEYQDNYINQSIDTSDFYPFYVVKNRSSISRRRSSLQSWTQRHRFRLVRRLVRKSGKSSIHQKSNTKRSFRFLLDISNTLIESSWIWTLLVLSFAFVITWVMFAGFWAIISIENVENWNGTNNSCLEGINSFAGYLLFSIETQSTIGYGGRYINEYCPEAIVGLCVQLIVGVGVCGSLICIVFLKMGGPTKHRNSTDCFSRVAVICQRDGELCLIFRVRDYDMRYECHTKIVAYLVQERRGELSLKVLKLQPAGILIWPVEVVHKIDETSPFWDLSAKDLIVKRFEIIVVMEGSSLTTSYMSRTTTSYLSREIRWGYKFTPCTIWDKKKRKYIVNHKFFNKTEEVVTPLCSAQRLSEVFDDVLYCTLPSNEPSIFSEYSKFSSPSTISPLVSKGKPFNNVNEINLEDEIDDLESEEDVVRREEIASVEINYRPKQYLNAKSEYDSSTSSGNDEYTTFMDLSIEELSKRKLRARRTISGTAKDFIESLQKYIKESNGNKNRSSKKYEETDF